MQTSGSPARLRIIGAVREPARAARNEKAATGAAFTLIMPNRDVQLPVALSTEIVTPGPMVELTAIFFM